MPTAQCPLSAGDLTDLPSVTRFHPTRGSTRQQLHGQMLLQGCNTSQPTSMHPHSSHGCSNCTTSHPSSKTAPSDSLFLKFSEAVSVTRLQQLSLIFSVLTPKLYSPPYHKIDINPVWENLFGNFKYFYRKLCDSKHLCSDTYFSSALLIFQLRRALFGLWSRRAARLHHV